MISLRSIRNQEGFTLVELLIVVIILAILAAIIVPQFSATTDDAKQSAYESNIANIRSAIDLYRQQHDGYPGALTSTGTCPGGMTNQAGALNTEAAFLAQLKFYTNSAGVACNGTDAIFKYGPYVKDDLPLNPLGSPGISTVDVGNAGLLGILTGNSGGWQYDTVTGEFIGDE